METPADEIRSARALRCSFRRERTGYYAAKKANGTVISGTISRQVIKGDAAPFNKPVYCMTIQRESSLYGLRSEIARLGQIYPEFHTTSFTRGVSEPCSETPATNSVHGWRSSGFFIMLSLLAPRTCQHVSFLPGCFYSSQMFSLFHMISTA